MEPPKENKPEPQNTNTTTTGRKKVAPRKKAAIDQDEVQQPQQTPTKSSSPKVTKQQEEKKQPDPVATIDETMKDLFDFDLVPSIHVAPPTTPQLTPKQVTVKPTETPTPSLKAFYCKDHYWEDACHPNTVIIASGEKDAYSLLVTNLHSVFGRDKVGSNPKITLTSLPIDSPGVCILSIGLGQARDCDASKYKSRPIVKQYKSESNSNDALKIFYCNSHYSSSTTPAASIMVAKDKNEATLFLLQLLSEMRLPDSRNTMIYPIDTLTPSVYFINALENQSNSLSKVAMPKYTPPPKPTTKSPKAEEPMDFSTPAYRPGSLAEKLGFGATVSGFNKLHGDYYSKI